MSDVALHDTAKRIGTYLGAQFPPRVPVALCMDKSPMTVAAMLGVLEAGCFYTIIDVQMPQQRVRLILDVLHPALLLTDAAKRRYGGYGGKTAMRLRGTAVSLRY